MADKKISVFGIYPSLTQAERGVDALVNGRFSHDDISVLAPDKQGTKDFAHEKHTKAPEGATTGAAAGGALGGTLGLLPASARLPFPVSGPSLRRAQSWARWLALVSAARSAGWSARSWVWASRSTKRSVTKGE